VARAAGGLLGAATLATAPMAQEPAGPPAGEPLPSFAELEAAGARIGEVRVVVEDIFDLNDPRESGGFYRAANALHFRTRAQTVRRVLPFGPGDRLTVAVIEEAERLLLTRRYLYDTRIRPVAWRDGVVDVEVRTRDTWTLYPGIGVALAGGESSSAVSLREYNLFGTGTTLVVSRFSNVDRSGTEWAIANDRAPGGLSLGFESSNNSDGDRRLARVARPFNTLDTRWAAGVQAAQDDRIDSVYNAGEIASQYRYRVDRAEVFGGWSTGRIDGRVHRHSVGVSLTDETYATEPGLVAPPQLNPDDRLVGPFYRWEFIEDRIVKRTNLNQVARPEFVAMGLQSALQLGWAARTFGSSRDALLYAGTVSRGFEPLPAHTLLASAALSGQYTDGRAYRQLLGARAQYFVPHAPNRNFYVSLAGDLFTNPAPLDTLLLGGDNGLRGYPLRYQAGTRRVLLTLEERLYTDQFWFNLFRVGAAAFVDVGRAWGGDNVNRIDPGWLADAGIGLRIFPVRASLANSLHVDLAFPIGSNNPDIKRVQLLFKARASF
jgi:hypothetical protein